MASSRREPPCRHGSFEVCYALRTRHKSKVIIPDAKLRGGGGQRRQDGGVCRAALAPPPGAPAPPRATH